MRNNEHMEEMLKKSESKIPFNKGEISFLKIREKKAIRGVSKCGKKISVYM